MTGQATIINGRIQQGENPVFVALVLGPNGSVIVLSEVTDYSIKVFDLSQGLGSTAIYSSGSLASASPPFFTGLQTDGYSVIPGQGYNFRLTFSAALFTQVGGHVYRFEFTINHSSFGVMRLIYDLTVGAVLS